MIFVTGASGNVGREVVRQLDALGVALRIGERKVSSDQRAVAFDFLDPSTFAEAVKGVDVVFLLRPPAISNTKATLNVLVDAARRAGVAQVVFVSVVGAGTMPFIPHHAVEQHLMAGPPGWTILRPGFFAQNLGGAYRRDIAFDDRIYLPAGAGRVAFIDARDIAQVAVMAMIEPARHARQIYTLTGPEALSFDEVAALLTTELSRLITYQPVGIARYVRHLLAHNTPLSLAIVQTLLHVGLRFGQAASVENTLARLLSREPTRLRDYIHVNQALWASQVAAPINHGHPQSPSMAERASIDRPQGQ
jgi:uncharacterized protein YbjT (DUF2867 family)